MNGHSPFARLAARLSPQARADIVYPLQSLIDGKSERETCQRTDSHWSEWGAYLAYRALIARIRRYVPNTGLVEPAAIEWRMRHSFGAMGVVMTPERSEQIAVAKLLKPRSRYVRIIQTEVRDACTVAEVDDPSLPTAVMFRDSYATAMAPFLAESFRRIWLVSSPNAVLYDLVEREKPDVVIFERAERALGWPPSEPDYNDFRSIYGDLMLDRDAAAAQKRSRSLLRERKVNEALAASEEALATPPRDAMAYSRALIHRARLLEMLGQLPTAFECLRHAATLEPGAALPLAAAARLRLHQGRNEDAAVLARRAAAAEPSVPDYHDLVATCLERAGDKEGAAAALEAELAIDGMRVSARLHLCRIRRGQGDMAEARRHAQAAVDIEPNNQINLATLANILVAQSDWAAGREVLQKAVDLYPGVDLFRRFLTLCEARLAEARRAAAAVPPPAQGPAQALRATEKKTKSKGRRK
ncbi:tetratricopeptide repeat protein [Oleomonas cavernae]|nr:tetratricopeptide repeat protein [Oleomonas cavernae]